MVMDDANGEPDTGLASPPADDEEIEIEHGVDKAVLAETPSGEEPDILRMVDYVDHFSLRGPSSTVRYRGARVKVYEQANDQFLLEDRVSKDGKHEITVKRMRAGSFGLRFLRSAYTLVTLLLVGFLFVFCFQIVLFLFLNLPVAGGATASQPLNTAKLIGTLLSMPLFIHAMGSIMALGTAFSSDTWNGHVLFRAMMDWPVVTVEWLCFIIFLGVPAFTIVVTLCAGKENWWEISALTWMISVFIMFIVFCVGVAFRELGACLDLVSIQNPSTHSETKWQRLRRLAKQAILLTQTARYSGTRDERYLVGDKDDYPKQGYATSPDYTPTQTRTGLYSKMTQLGFLHKIFVEMDPPTRRYNIEEIRDIVPFVTSQNWSLEKIYCRTQRARVIYAVKGPSALEPGQMKSNLACTLIGVLLVSGMILGLLLWIAKPTLTVVFVALILAVCCILPAVRSSLDLYRTHENIRDTDDMEVGDEQDASMYQVWETVTISKPREWYCWTRATLDVIFLFAWPLITLYNSNNAALGTLFLILGLFSGLRIYFNASWVLSELGSVDGVDLSLKDDATQNAGSNISKIGWGLKSIGFGGSMGKTRAHRALLAKARTSEVIGKISRTSSVSRWMWFYGLFAVVAAVMLLQAADADILIPAGGRPPIVKVNDFFYPPQPDLSYPTCEMTKGFTIPGHGASALGDYAFLAALSYETPSITQFHLDSWFAAGGVVDESEFVDQYRIESGTVNHPVYFKLFSFPDIPGYGIISIRGSQTTWDFLVDAQLWSAAFLAQIVRALIPLGWLWTPILDNLVTVVNFVEGESLKNVAYYKVTTNFVNAVLENNYTFAGKSFHTLRVTGASLGGGLAIITGAQTRANAIAISGLNAGLSRNTFEPPVTHEQLNSRVFNVIPDRDIIARVGDRGRLFQELECRAPMNSLLGCHSMWRSVCEIAYTCGTGDRPVLCRCVEKFGYPEPIQNGTRTFADACAEEEESALALEVS